MQESAERAFQAYGRPIARFALLRYLVQILTASDDDWPTMVGDLWKAQNS